MSSFVEAFARGGRPDSRRRGCSWPAKARRDPRWRQAIGRSPVANSIRLIGYHSEPERLISLADVCVLTSMREGLPRVVMQYLAGGRPCVASHLPGIEEVVRHGVNGIVTPADDVSAAAAAVADLLENEPYRARLADGARRTDLSSWGLDAMCEQVETVYRSVLGSAAGAVPSQPAEKTALTTHSR